MSVVKLLLATTAIALAATTALAQPASATQPAQAGVYRFADGSRVSGAVSTLNTGAAGASFTLRTSGLPAGHTVTVWYVIFNRPQNCTHGELGLRCGPGDLPIFGGDDSAVTSVVYAAGHVIGGAGDGGYAGFLAIGDTSGALFGPGLVDPTTADIHLVVHDHGVLDPQQLADGIHHFGPCNPCTDLQFSPHEQ